MFENSFSEVSSNIQPRSPLTCWNNRKLRKKIIPMRLTLNWILRSSRREAHRTYWLEKKYNIGGGWRGWKWLSRRERSTSKKGIVVKESSPNTTSPKKFNSAFGGSGSLAFPPRQKLKEGVEKCIALLEKKKKKRIMWRKQKAVSVLKYPLTVGYFPVFLQEWSGTSAINKKPPAIRDHAKVNSILPLGILEHCFDGIMAKRVYVQDISIQREAEEEYSQRLPY